MASERCEAVYLCRVCGFRWAQKERAKGCLRCDREDFTALAAPSIKGIGDELGDKVGSAC